MSRETDDDLNLTRRQALERLGSLALVTAGAGVAGCDPAPVIDDDDATAANDDDATDDDDTTPADDDDSASPDCVLQPAQTEGPFWFDVEQVRSDISEDRQGWPLDVRLRVVDAATCQPIADAVVDLWHCDANGWYSGYPGQGDANDVDTTGQTFLRGLQVTDKEGRVQFTSVYPGWYPGRAVHMHVKVHLDNNTLITTQTYFPDAVSDAVHAKAPYATRGPRDTRNPDDGWADEAKSEGLMMKATAEAASTEVSLTIGVATA